eukprot:1953135-Karenia_brevis.AAC.1
MSAGTHHPTNPRSTSPPPSQSKSPPLSRPYHNTGRGTLGKRTLPSGALKIFWEKVSMCKSRGMQVEGLDWPGRLCGFEEMRTAHGTTCSCKPHLGKHANSTSQQVPETAQ